MRERDPIVVYGASGFTGRLVCAALDRRGVRFRIAGRDRDRLRLLAGALGRVSGEVVDVAPLDDARALEKMASRARVVLDCAGPFAKMGKPVLDACLATKTHFLDITGELSWMLATWKRDDEVRAAGIAAVNAVGFDVVPTDCAAALAAEALGAPVEAVRIAICAMRARPTQGTARSALGILASGGFAWREGSLVKEKLGAERWRVPFPDPIGPRETMSGPIGDLVTAPRTTGAKTVRCFVSVPKRTMRIAPIASALLRVPGMKPIAERWVRRLPEGPSLERRKRAVTAAYAEVTGRSGTRTAWVSLGDAYDFTAEAAAECAIRASADSFAARGSLSPAQAFGAKPLLAALEPAAGVRYTVT